MPAVINASGRGIYPGIALVIENERAYLPSTEGPLASCVSMDGAPANGVVTIATSGVVSLDDWSLSTGGKFLTPGQVYYVGEFGQLNTSGIGQPIGQAISRNDLSIHISVSVNAPQVTVINQSNVQVAQRVYVGTGSPNPTIGHPGDVYIQKGSPPVIWGPKGEGTWFS
jgi:hypothetical protein